MGACVHVCVCACVRGCVCTHVASSGVGVWHGADTASASTYTHTHARARAHPNAPTYTLNHPCTRRPSCSGSRCLAQGLSSNDWRRTRTQVCGPPCPRTALTTTVVRPRSKRFVADAPQARSSSNSIKRTLLRRAASPLTFHRRQLGTVLVADRYRVVRISLFEQPTRPISGPCGFLSTLVVHICVGASEVNM